MPSPLAARELTATVVQPTFTARPKRLYSCLAMAACLWMTGALLSACSPRGDGTHSVAQQTDENVGRRSAEKKRAVAAAALSKPVADMALEAPAPAAAPAPVAASAVMESSATAQSAPNDAAAQRFLAVRHHMQIETAAADLAGLWGAVKARCEQLDCQIEASALQRETSHSAGSAYLVMRVNPRDFAMLTDALGGKAKVLNHQTSSEDKTGEVVDVEAQIKNRSEYRDSLRELLREKDVKRKLSDLMEIRDTLSQVQAEIDAAQAQRKLLEKQTAKQFVQMQFQPQQAVISGTYSPWQQTWEGSWNALTGSAQAMVLLVAGLLPWALVLGVGMAIVVCVLRLRLRAKKRSSALAVAAAEPELQKS